MPKNGARKYFVMEKYLSSELERICHLSSLKIKLPLYSDWNSFSFSVVF